MGSCDDDSIACTQELFEKAFNKIVRSANARELSSVKAKSKLSQAGFPEAVIQKAIKHAVRLSIIDDVRYCECLVRSALSQSKGLRFVLKEIEELSIDPYSLDAFQAYAALSENDEINRALYLLNKRPCRAKDVRSSCMRRLLSKGYTFEVARSATKLYMHDMEEQA